MEQNIFSSPPRNKKNIPTKPFINTYIGNNYSLPCFDRIMAGRKRKARANHVMQPIVEYLPDTDSDDEPSFTQKRLTYPYRPLEATRNLSSPSQSSITASCSESNEVRVMNICMQLTASVYIQHEF